MLATLKLKTSAVLNMGQNGQITIPVDYRKEHSMKGGDHLVSIRMGDALVLVPHDSIFEALSSRFEASMKAAGLTVDDMKQRTLSAREQMFEAHYGSIAAEPTKPSAE